MKLTIERETLLSSLSFIKKYVERRSTIPSLTHLLIVAGKGVVAITGTNLDQSASDSVSADVSEVGSALIDAHMLFDAIKRAGGPEVSIETDDTRAIIKCGKSRLKLSILDVQDFPEVPMITDECAVNFSIDGLGDIADRVTFAASTEPTRYYLCGTSWMVRDGKIEFVATDGKTLSLMRHGIPDGADGLPAIIVPTFDFPEWTGLVDVSVSDRFIRYRHGSQVVASKLIDGSFPDYSRVIPDNDIVLKFDRKALAMAISRVSVVGGTRDNSILFTGTGDTLSVSSISGDDEAADELGYDGPDFQIALMNSVILPILASFDCDVIEWRYKSSMDPLTVHEPGENSRLAVAMPVRDKRLAG